MSLYSPSEGQIFRAKIKIEFVLYICKLYVLRFQDWILLCFIYSTQTRTWNWPPDTRRAQSSDPARSPDPMMTFCAWFSRASDAKLFHSQCCVKHNHHVLYVTSKKYRKKCQKTEENVRLLWVARAHLIFVNGLLEAADLIILSVVIFYLWKNKSNPVDDDWNILNNLVNIF